MHNSFRKMVIIFSNFDLGYPVKIFFFFTFQFGNTCYSNSVLQALYFCKPFREKVLEYKAKNKKGKETLLSCLADLFYSIATQKKKVGTIAPKKFIARLRKEKGEYFFIIILLQGIKDENDIFFKFFS